MAKEEKVVKGGIGWQGGWQLVKEGEVGKRKVGHGEVNERGRGWQKKCWHWQDQQRRKRLAEESLVKEEEAGQGKIIPAKSRTLQKRSFGL